MCDRAYTPAAIAELQRIAAYPAPRRSHLRTLFAQVAAAIAASPRVAHRDMVGELVSELRLAGVAADVVEACECALGEVG